ncbi:MAG: hypothetical protein Q4C95_12965 [Planctomycetia bacterium]|nr:hypothetical protein [Planctomycetia bacterium]
MISKKCLHDETWKILSSFFETPEIISKIICFKDRLRVVTVSLEDLWPAKLRGDEVLDEFASCYFIARERYFSSHFNPKLSEDYVYRYFVLLEHILNKLQRNSEYSRLLEHLLTMDVCGVYHNDSIKPDFAAVFSLRNPVYLLSRLRYPNLEDSAKFLPLVALPKDKDDLENRYFYHYRQFTSPLKNNDDMKIFSYIPLEQENREMAFRLFFDFSSLLSYKKDPRIEARARKLSQYVFIPVLCNYFKNQKGQIFPFRFADVGCGSGFLGKSILSQCLDFAKSYFRQQLSLDWTLIDIDLKNTKSLIKEKKVFRSLSRFSCVRKDYFDWYYNVCKDRQKTLTENKYDLLLISRLLNNFSDFTIEWVDDWYQVSKLGGKKLDYHSWISQDYLPRKALNNTSRSVINIIDTCGRVRLLRGTTYRQASLSPYFSGLYFLRNNAFPKCDMSRAIFFCARRYNDQCLSLKNGESLLTGLCKLAKYVVIEDVDFDYREFHRHCKKSNLIGKIHLLDLTQKAKLLEAKLLVVSSEESNLTELKNLDKTFKREKR